jgi:hypothetical protein
MSQRPGKERNMSITLNFHFSSGHADSLNLSEADRRFVVMREVKGGKPLDAAQADSELLALATAELRAMTAERDAATRLAEQLATHLTAIEQAEPRLFAVLGSGGGFLGTAWTRAEAEEFAGRISGQNRIVALIDRPEPLAAEQAKEGGAA